MNKKFSNLVSKLNDKITEMNVKEKSEVILEIAKKHSEKVLVSGYIAMEDLSRFASQTDLVQKLNNYKSEISKSMDEGFKMGASDLETGLKMMPKNHRILDGGHDFFETINRAKEIGETNGWSDSETFSAWFRAYFTDLSSPAGMPVLGKLTDDVYAFLRDPLGFSEENARDLVTVNGQEAIEAILGGSLAVLGLFLAWNKEDKEGFSKTIGSLGLISVLQVNPAVAIIVIIAAGLGYNSLVCHKAASRGAITSAAALLTSAIIPGPVLLGLLAGIVMGFYINKKMGKDFDLVAYVKVGLDKIKNPSEREMFIDELNELLASLSGKYETSGKKA